MKEITLKQLGVALAHAISAAMLQNAPLTKSAKAKLRLMALEFISASERVGDTSSAVQAIKAKAATRRAAEPFTLEWRSTGKVEQIIGWRNLSARVGLTEASLQGRFSTGKGQFTRLMYDESGNVDNVTISRVNYAPGVGRPKSRDLA